MGVRFGWMWIMVWLVAIGVANAVETPAATQTIWPGSRSDWKGSARYDFPTAGKNTIVAVPNEPAKGNPWIWRAQFWGNASNVDEELLRRGYHVVFLDEGDTLGCPDAMKHWEELYRLLTEKYGLSRKPALEGLSRGGLFVYNWAALHPEAVGCIYGDNPVCDFRSWPAGGPNGQKEWEKLIKLYGFKSAEEAKASKASPIDELEPLAKAKVPVLHVVADADKSVPYEENSAVLKERYLKLGGPYEEIIKHGMDHHPHGLDNPKPIVEFILKWCGGRK